MRFFFFGPLLDKFSSCDIYRHISIHLHTHTHTHTHILIMASSDHLQYVLFGIVFRVIFRQHSPLITPYECLVGCIQLFLVVDMIAFVLDVQCFGLGSQPISPPTFGYWGFLFAVRHILTRRF